MYHTRCHNSWKTILESKSLIGPVLLDKDSLRQFLIAKDLIELTEDDVADPSTESGT